MVSTVAVVVVSAVVAVALVTVEISK